MIDYWRLSSYTPPLTAAVPNITSLLTAIQAAARPWMAAVEVKDVFYDSPKGRG